MISCVLVHQTQKIIVFHEEKNVIILRKKCEVNLQMASGFWLSLGH
jgi:hypothetical protein